MTKLQALKASTAPTLAMRHINDPLVQYLQLMLLATVLMVRHEWLLTKSPQ